MSQVKGTINQAIETGAKKRKSVKVIQRYLRMKYRINISSSSLNARIEKAKPSFS